MAHEGMIGTRIDWKLLKVQTWLKWLSVFAYFILSADLDPGVVTGKYHAISLFCPCDVEAVG